MTNKKVGIAIGALWLLAAGCGSTTATDAGQKDMTLPPDMTLPADMTALPDLIPPPPSPTLILQDVATLYLPAMGNPIPVRTLVTVVVNPDPMVNFTHDLDARVPPSPLGCFADHYDLAGAGKKPRPDLPMGDVSFTGYTAGKTIDNKTAADSIHCAFTAMTKTYTCGYGPLMAGVPGDDPTTYLFPGDAIPIPPGKAIRAQYTGAGALGTYDSGNAAAATDTLAVTENLFTIKYNPTADTVLHFTCPDKPMGVCGGFEAVLVQLIASQKKVGEMGYPGADYGTVNCSSVIGSGMIKIPKEMIAAMFGSSVDLTQVLTRVVRGGLPPQGQMDSKGNVVTVAIGRGVMGVAPK